MKNYWITFTLLFSGFTGHSQIAFQKTYGGTNHDFGLTVQQTTDGGYMLFGHTWSYGAGQQDMYLVKTDNWGNEQWYQAYGTENFEFGVSAQQTTDGGYILCGGYSGLDNDSLALIKTDAGGNVIWNRRYDGSVGREVGQSVLQTPDGGYIAVGFTGTSFTEDVYIVKTNATGDVTWSKIYAGSGRDFAFDVKRTSDGGYIMVGETNSWGHGGKDMFLLRTNSVGDTLWTKTFGTASNEIGSALDITSDGGFILIGYEDFSGGNAYLVKTDADGNEEWSEYYGGTGWDFGYSVRQSTDGGYILAGRKENTGIGTNDMYCVKTDNTGGIVWEYTYPNGIMSDAYSVQQTSDGGYVVLGSAYDGIENQMYLVKTNGSGIVSLFEGENENLNVTVFPNPFTEQCALEIEGLTVNEYSLEILSVQGMTLRSMDHLSSGKVTIERGNLAAGMYIFRLSSEGRVMASGKLIVE